MDTIRTYTDEDAARSTMRRENKANPHGLTVVIVEGPCDGEWSLMTIKEAIMAGFVYGWES